MTSHEATKKAVEELLKLVNDIADVRETINDMRRDIGYIEENVDKVEDHVESAIKGMTAEMERLEAIDESLLDEDVENADVEVRRTSLMFGVYDVYHEGKRVGTLFDSHPEHEDSWWGTIHGHVLKATAGVKSATDIVGFLTTAFGTPITVDFTDMGKDQ